MAHHIEILYEDDYLVCINKEAGVLTVADRFNIDSVHYQSLMRKKYGEIFTIHRLDKDTSGVICFAKNAEVHKALSEMFEMREVEKYYIALVEGNTPDTGDIDEPLALSESKPGTMKVHKKGKPSHTTFTTTSRYDHFSVLEVQIHTGRMHQIRVHLSYIGFPLFIDPIYGRRSEFRLSELKGRKYRIGKYTEEERPLMSRLSLHALRLKFIHPVTKDILIVEAPIPKDIKAVINQAKKLNSK